MVWTNYLQSEIYTKSDHKLRSFVNWKAQFPDTTRQDRCRAGYDKAWIPRIEK